MNIRQAEPGDVSRIAEILVFNNRVNYWPIFKDDGYSFGELQVLPVANELLQNEAVLRQIFVYDDGIVKGFLHMEAGEIKKLYVDTFFQSQGIGAALITYALESENAGFLWALEKNTRALAFYHRHGFHETGERKHEEGTEEFLVRLEWTKSFFQRVYEIVSQIPEGCVVSYGQIARMLGTPRSARVVGWAMRKCPETCPWHRVICEDGTMAAGDAYLLQRAMLKQEGILFVDDAHVDVEKCRWRPV